VKKREKVASVIGGTCPMRTNAGSVGCRKEKREERGGSHEIAKKGGVPAERRTSLQVRQPQTARHAQKEGGKGGTNSDTAKQRERSRLSRSPSKKKKKDRMMSVRAFTPPKKQKKEGNRGTPGPGDPKKAGMVHTDHRIS